MTLRLEFKAAIQNSSTSVAICFLKKSWALRLESSCMEPLLLGPKMQNKVVFLQRVLLSTGPDAETAPDSESFLALRKGESKIGPSVEVS